MGFALTSGRTVFVNGLEALRDPEHSNFIELTLTAATSSVFTAFDSGNSTLGLSSFVDDSPSLWH